jgi:NAD(P)H-hydrate epimerase
MRILTAAEMREVDRLTIEQYGQPGLLLMENAAARAVEAIEKRYGPFAGRRALIVCGKGNNGGDGAAIARLVQVKGASADIILLGRVADARGDARTNFDAVAHLSSTAGSGLRLVEVESLDQLQKETAATRYDFLIDAIFGTGLARPAAGLFEDAIGFINRRAGGLPVIAVDIPSGLASDSAEPIGPAVRASLTVTFTAPKIANILPPASDYNGELVIGPIGSPDELVRGSGSRLNLVTGDDIQAWLASSRRGRHANKGDVGKVLVIAGSRGKTGAASLAGSAAMRAGAGLVTVATPESSQPVVASQIIAECMTESLSETSSGAVSREATERALELASARDVLAIGPGLGSSEESTRAFVRALAMRRSRPMVIDADGLNSLVPWGENLRGSNDLPMILTPHPGEMSRLTGKLIPEVVRNRVELAREFATSHGVIVVLKGSRTIVAAPDGEAYVNPTGNAGMATGGTGDVLTGIIAGLVAQKRDDPVGAAVAAVYLHGLAGDIAASRVGLRAMIASDISSHLGDAFIEAGGGAERIAR